MRSSHDSRVRLSKQEQVSQRCEACFCYNNERSMEGTGMPQRILVVDDDRQIVRLISAYLERAGFQTLTAHDGASALRLVRSERPNLMVLDLMLPDADGADLTRLIRADPHLASMPIIMLTARVDDTDKIIGLELGADDYMTKPFNPREVVARVRAVLRRAGGGALPSSTMLEAGRVRLDPDRHEVHVADQPLNLTPTEFHLLRLFLSHPGHAFTRRELIESGPGYEYEGMERTIDSHIKNLRRKLDAVDAGIKIETVYGVGYRLKVVI